MAESDGGAAANAVASAAARYGTVLYPAQDAILGPSLREYGEWAQHEIDLLLDLLPAGGTAVDAGAFVGTHTLAFARHAGATCRVLAFEPNPASFELLVRNVALNDVRNVSTHCLALGARSGVLAFEAHPAEAGNFGHARLTGALAGGGARVQVITLDTLALAECDLLKIDVEGMEADVLLGAHSTLERCRPVVYCECNTLAQGWPVVQLMREHGFACDGHVFTAYNAGNFRGNADNLFGDARELGLLFVPEERLVACARVLDDPTRLVPIETLDDLALCLLRKPQYKTEVLAHTAAAARLGTAFIADPSVAEASAALHAQLDRIQRALDEAQSLAWTRAADIERLDRRLADTQAAHEAVQELARARATELREQGEALAQARRQLAAAGNGAGTRTGLASETDPPIRPDTVRAPDTTAGRQHADGHD